MGQTNPVPTFQLPEWIYRGMVKVLLKNPVVDMEENRLLG
jgi:hypothetical protein